MKNGLVIDKDGNRLWYLNDKLHRTDGPAVEHPGGDKEWWVDGKLHRTDGPAIERIDGIKEWWVDGKQHRIDGPAVVFADGSKEWWVDGTYLGAEDKGFWNLWDRLSNKQRSNLNLLLHLPSVV